MVFGILEYDIAHYFYYSKRINILVAKPVPEGFQSVTPYLSINRATEAIEFYKRAFNATEIFRLPTPGGEIGHADIVIGDSHIMLSDPCEESPIPSPQSLGGSSVGLHVYVEDVDKY